MNGSIAGAWLASAIIVGAAIGSLALIDASDSGTANQIVAADEFVEEFNEMREIQLESDENFTDPRIAPVSSPAF